DGVDAEEERTSHGVDRGAAAARRGGDPDPARRGGTDPREAPARRWSARRVGLRADAALHGRACAAVEPASRDDGCDRRPQGRRIMTTWIRVTAQLEPKKIARIDKLAARHGISRAEMLRVLVRAGLDAHKRGAAGRLDLVEVDDEDAGRARELYGADGDSVDRGLGGVGRPERGHAGADASVARGPAACAPAAGAGERDD